MDINPLSLLEVTMGSDQVEEDDDDDCIILDPPIETHIIEDNDPPAPEPEPEIDASAGYHFLQTETRVEDPLALERPFGSPQLGNKSIPYLWVSTNINNLSKVSNAEHEFRKTHYKEVHNVLKDNLHCTICQDHVGCDVRIHPKSIEHPVLRVLICEKCFMHYKNLQFVLNDKGKETRCRWCGKSPMGGGSPLRRCQQCPFSFCELCLRRNLPNAVEPRNAQWVCCVCNLKQLWPARSLLWALQTLKTRCLSKPSNSNFGAEGDMSMCCKKRVKKPNFNVALFPKLAQAQDSGRIKVNRTLFQQPKFIKLALPTEELGTRQFHLVNVPQLTQPSNSKQPVLNVNVQPARQYRPPTPMPKDVPPPETDDECNNTSTMNCENDRVDTSWLKNKIDSYRKDLTKISERLEGMYSDVPDFDTIKNIELRMETVSNLLSLGSGLLKDSGSNLLNTWKERKARHMIEKIQSPTSVPSQRQETPRPEEPHRQQNRTPEKTAPASLRSKQAIPPEQPKEKYTLLKAALANIKNENSPKKNRKKPKRLTFRPKKGQASYSAQLRLAKQLSMNDLKNKYKLKECFVSLQKLQW